uniref:Rab-GAP TBC domain-containing protein n=1 Tax=Schistosoma mansoni TaxID=6183 RepID=A0A3Q0KUD4_SCHMA
MASIETGSSCFTECLGSIIDQMCRKSSYSNSVKLINLNYSNENVAQSFTYQVVSVLKGTIIPYSLRRFLWPLALFTVAEWTRSEFENPIIWNGHKMRELESTARRNFGVLLASGTAKLGLTTPTCSKFDDIINKTVKEISLELEIKFKNQQKQFKRFKEQSVKILNVFYTAKQIYDPFYIYWLLPIHFALNKEHIYELIKHFPDIPTKVSNNSADEGIQIYSFALYLSLFIDIMNKKYGLYHNNINNIIEKTMNNINKLQCIQHIQNVYKEFILENSNKKLNFELFVGTVNSIALLFFWDQLFLNSFNCDIIIEFAETILVLLGSDILQINNLGDMEQLFNHGPNKLLTKDIIQTWNMIHSNKVLDDNYYKLNRLSGKLVSITKEIQETSKKYVNFYLQDFVIHNIIVTTVTDSRKILPPHLFRTKLDYIVEDEIKQSILTETIPTIIFHGKITRIYDFIDQIYSTDEEYSKNKPSSIINYSYPSFIQEQSKMYITMFQFNMEQSFPFMIYPYKLWTREVINPIEQGTYPEISYDSAWTLDYLLIPFNYLFYHFYSLPIIEIDNYIPLQLLHGSRISLQVYNPNLEVVPKVIEQPTIYITRSVQTKEIYRETVDIEDTEYLQEEQIIDEEVENIEELSPPATPIEDPWVPFKKLAPYERLMKPSSLSEPFCIYIDQLRFMPDNSTIFKVTGRLLNTKYDEELLDILTVPEENLDIRETSRSPVFSPNQRFIVNLSQNKTLSQNSLLFLRVYTLTLTNLEYVVIGNVLLKLFNSNEPLPQPEYRFRSYRSAESTPTNFEWVLYHQFQSDENRKKGIRSMVKMILRREGEFDKSSEQNDFLTPDYLYRYTLQRLSIKRNTTANGIPNQMISAFPFFYRVNDGFLLSLKDAKGLTVKEGDYIFGLAKVIRGSDTSLMPVNKFYGFGSDDDLLFDKFDPTMSLENPKWEDAPQLTKPYYDSNALLIIQIFRVPLVFTIGGSINITKSGNWFTPQLVSRNPNKRQITKLRRIHLISWSFLRLFDWGFLRNGTHKLCLLKPPIRLRTLHKIQNKDEEKSVMLRSDSFLENASLTIQLQSARFLDFSEELKIDQQPYHSHIPNNEHDTVDEYENNNQQMKVSSRTNLDAMAEFRAKSDTNWLQQGEIGSDKLYAEIHEFLKNQLASCSSKKEYIPLFFSRI